MLDRTRTQQRKFKRLTAGQLTDMLGNGVPPGSSVDDSSGDGTAADDTDAVPGASTDPSGPDDPTDPTDTTGDVPPLEDPVTGEPNDPPVAPPS